MMVLRPATSVILILLCFLPYDSFSSPISFVTSTRSISSISSSTTRCLSNEKSTKKAFYYNLLKCRGGDDDDTIQINDDDEEDDEDEVDVSDTEEEDEEEEEEEEEEEDVDEDDDVTLSSSLKSKSSSSSSSSSSSLSRRRVPSLLSLLPTPSSLLSVLRLYFKSLFDPSFPTLHDLDMTPADGLRSSLERSGRRRGRGDGGGGRRVKKMKRGKARTLSDLPKLNS